MTFINFVSFIPVMNQDLIQEASSCSAYMQS